MDRFDTTGLVKRTLQDRFVPAVTPQVIEQVRGALGLNEPDYEITRLLGEPETPNQRFQRWMRDISYADLRRLIGELDQSPPVAPSGVYLWHDAEGPWFGKQP